MLRRGARLCAELPADQETGQLVTSGILPQQQRQGSNLKNTPDTSVLFSTRGSRCWVLCFCSAELHTDLDAVQGVSRTAQERSEGSNRCPAGAIESKKAKCGNVSSPLL